MAVDEIEVEVVYASPERQRLLTLEVPAGTTALEAVRRSGIVEEFPEIDVEENAMGIFSKLLNGKDWPTPAEYILKPHDRVEIYRPLVIDPKEARLARAKKKARKG